MARKKPTQNCAACNRGSTRYLCSSCARTIQRKLDKFGMGVRPEFGRPQGIYYKPECEYDFTDTGVKKVKARVLTPEEVAAAQQNPGNLPIKRPR